MTKLQDYIDRYIRVHNKTDPVIIDSKEVYLSHSRPYFFDGAHLTRKFLPYIQRVIDIKQKAISILDYGCGQALHTYMGVSELNRLNFSSYFEGWIQSYYCYDPAVEKFNTKPTIGSQFDIVCCADVLQLIPEEHIDRVLTDINQYTKQDGVVLISVSGDNSRISFNDGQPINVTTMPYAWWQEKIDNIISCCYMLIYMTDSGDNIISAKDSAEFSIQALNSSVFEKQVNYEK